MPRLLHKRLDCSPGCAVEAALMVIDGKWKGVILWHLLGGTRRFSDLRRAIPSVSQRMLTAQLRHLEEDGIISRQIFAEVPSRVEYSMTALGLSLKPILEALKQWGDHHMQRQSDHSPDHAAERALAC